MRGSSLLLMGGYLPSLKDLVVIMKCPSMKYILKQLHDILFYMILYFSQLYHAAAQDGTSQASLHSYIV